MFNNLLFKLTLKYPVISKFIHSHDGFIPDEESEKDYWFGANKIKGETLVENGQWLDFTPVEEYQAGKYVETMGCTGYALNNCIEMIAKKKYNKEWNKSDRYTNKMSGTTKSGNSMRNVMDTIRNTAGMVNESSWAWDKSTFNWYTYYADIPNEVKNLGAGWLKRYMIGYERVYTNKQLMMSALKESPLYVSGYAWYIQNGLYKSYGNANHAFTIVGYVEGSHWLAFDSYSPFIKRLDWNYDFFSAYKIYLEDKELEYNKQLISELRGKGFRLVMRTDKVNGGKGQIYELTEENILKELQDQEKINEAIRQLSKMKELTGISEELYFRLIK